MRKVVSKEVTAGGGFNLFWTLDSPSCWRLSIKLRNVLYFTQYIHVYFISNHFISNLVLDSLKFKKLLELHVYFIRNHFINVALDSLKFKKLLELQGKSLETLGKQYFEIFTWFNIQLCQNNVNIK